MTMRKGQTRRFLAACLACLLAGAMLLPAAPAGARQPGPDGHGQRQPGPDRHGQRGPVYGRPPQGHVVVRHHDRPYYYHRGYYYRPYQRGGYVVVRPPVGLFLAALPIGFATLMLGGMTYYSYSGVYYRPAPGGYVVVDPPAGYVVATPPPPLPFTEPEPSVSSTDPNAVAAASVTVIVPSLNLRSGPGLNFPIVAVATMGETLLVLGNAPGWLWVQTPGGQSGWAAQQYTAPTVNSGASG